jgi:hypothetical protein
MSMRVRSAFAALPLALSFLVLLALPSRLAGQAQASTGVIRGTVSDTTGAPLAGATVTVLNRETNASRSMTTNSSGASWLAPGRHLPSRCASSITAPERDGIRAGLGEAANQLPIAAKRCSSRKSRRCRGAVHRPGASGSHPSSMRR